MKPNNLVEAEEHAFLLSEIAYIGPVFVNWGPDGGKKCFAVSLHSGICFYLDPLCRDDLLRRWREWWDTIETIEVDYSALLRRAALYARDDDAGRLVSLAEKVL